MKKNYFLPALVVIASVGLFLYISLKSRGPDERQYENLKDGRITVLPAQKMIEFEIKGIPSETSGKAIGMLYRTFYNLKNNKVKNPIIRARWQGSLDNPESITGRFGMAVSEEVTEIPPEAAAQGIRLAIWEYGMVAEILHKGPYDREKPAVEKLQKFIKDNGYTIIDSHEEEYIRGPSFVFDDPSKYITIIRYRVKKAK